MAMVAWLLFASKRPVTGVVVAVDKDQARLDRDHLERFVRLNPWLGTVLKVDSYRATNTHTGSTVEILSSDVASSYGLLIDFAVCDEVTIWPKRDLFDSILSAVAKRPNCLLMCIGNAGFCESWQWALREAIRTDPAWYFSRLDGPQATWITADLLAEQQRLLPAVAYARLWLNEWSSGSGDALESPLIARAFDESLCPMQGTEAGWSFVAGLDLGIRPQPGRKVSLVAVEQHLVELHRRFRVQRIAVDPWQAIHLIERLRLDTHEPSNWITEIPPTGGNLRAMATVLLESFQDGRIACYPCEALRRDLERLRVEERSYGYRLTSPRDATGHGDLASAFTLALLVATNLASKAPAIVTVNGGVRIDGVWYHVGGSPPGETPLQRDLRRLQAAQEYEERLRTMPDPDPWLQAMRMVGRAR